MFLLAGGFKKLKNMLVKWDYFSDYDGFWIGESRIFSKTSEHSHEKNGEILYLDLDALKN